MNFIIIAIVIVSIYLAISLVGFSKVAASISGQFDTRFLRPVKFINNQNLQYDIDVPVEETSLAMMRGVDESEPGKDDLQVGDLVKVRGRSYDSKFCANESLANEIDYYGRVVGFDRNKAKIQWTFYKVAHPYNSPNEAVCGGDPSPSDSCKNGIYLDENDPNASEQSCCSGQRECHIKDANEELKEIKSLFGTSDMTCSDCPVASKVNIDRLKKVKSIPGEYLDGDWLENISTSNNLMNNSISDFITN